MWRLLGEHRWIPSVLRGSGTAVRATDLTESASICGGCWESIDGFHQFYVGAEQLYERKEVPFGLEGRIIKQETGSEVFLVEMARDDDMEIKEELGSDVEESDALKEELVGGETAGDVVEQMMKEESEHDSEDDYEEDEDDGDDKDDEGDDPDNFIKQHVVLNCDQCEASDFSFKGLVTHLQRIHNVVKCYVTCCGIRYHTRVRLLEHVKYITDPTSFKCDHCEEPQYFINVPALKRHKKLKHNIQVTTRLYNMENRLKKDKTPVEKTEEQLKKLEEQEKRRSDRAAEDKMMRDHVTFGCVPCGTTFETYTDLFRHSRIEHKQKPVVVCCGNRYHQRPRLLQHIQSVVNPTAFRCELCFRCFKSNYARNVHCAEMHPTEESVKPHSAASCASGASRVTTPGMCTVPKCIRRRNRSSFGAIGAQRCSCARSSIGSTCRTTRIATGTRSSASIAANSTKAITSCTCTSATNTRSPGSFATSAPNRSS
ncbi:hypothetical protein RP20_CCG017784 [Aedes albopictus]|nr:hypothetical protein RP20_CCG017784 [Aedes albopictus]